MTCRFAQAHRLSVFTTVRHSLDIRRCLRTCIPPSHPQRTIAVAATAKHCWHLDGHSCRRAGRLTKTARINGVSSTCLVSKSRMSRQKRDRIALSTVLCNVRSGEDGLPVYAVEDIDDETRDGRCGILLRVKETLNFLRPSLLTIACAMTYWHMPSSPPRSFGDGAPVEGGIMALRRQKRCLLTTCPPS